MRSVSTAHTRRVRTRPSTTGTGLSEGDTVAASIDGTECDSTTANAAGEWVVRVGPGDCSPEDGDTVSFSLNGDAAEQTETWSGGGFGEVSLTVAAMPEPDNGDDNGDAMPGDGDVAMPDTGNAGLVTSSSSSPLAALALAFFAVAGIAGARVATRRVS